MYKNSKQRRVISAAMALSVSLVTALAGYQADGAYAADAKPAAVPARENTIVLNFADAEISTIIEAVSKFTGQNFIIDPRVKGKVTIISQRPMNADQVYQVFLSILKVHGFAAIPGPDVVKIVPDVNAKQDAIDTITGTTGSEGDELVTQVIEVKHVDANQLVPILRPLVPQRGHLASVPSSNVIIIADSANNIARLSQIIQRIDTVSGDEIEVVPLQHASATEVSRILTQLDSKDPKAAADRPKVVSDERTNSLLLSGDKTTRLRLKALIAHLDTPLEVGGNTHVVYLRNAVAKDLVPVLTGVSQNLTKGKKAAATAAAVPGSEIVIQADENTNALVITCPPDVFRSLKSVIGQLDVRRAQVLVEGVIAEVSKEKTRELGVQWAVDGRDGGNAVGLVNFSLGTPITAYANLDNPPNPIGLNIGIGDFTGTNKIAALVSALAGDSHTNILATPSLVTLDNQEAEIVVGQNVPFVTGSYANTGGGTTPTNPFNTIQRQDVGLTLKVKPQINEGDAIRLDVSQEVSSIAPSSQAADIITNKRAIKTNVLVDDGQIVVLGGLIQDDLRESEQKVPGLGDIPLLGWLFRYQKTQKVKTNLMVFLHPVIMKDNNTMLALTSKKYGYLRGQQMDMKEQGLRLMSNEETPVLPEMKEFLSLPPPYEESTQRLELTKPAAQVKAAPVSEPAQVQSAPQPAANENLALPPVSEPVELQPMQKPSTADPAAPPPPSMENSPYNFEPPFIGDTNARPFAQ